MYSSSPLLLTFTPLKSRPKRLLQALLVLASALHSSFPQPLHQHNPRQAQSVTPTSTHSSCFLHPKQQVPHTMSWTTPPPISRENTTHILSDGQCQAFSELTLTTTTSSEQDTDARLHTLPDELILEITSYLALDNEDDAFTPQARSYLDSLRALSLSCQKLNRIVTPVLYATVPVTLTIPIEGFGDNRNKPPYMAYLYTTSGCNASKLLHTLFECPSLRQHVKHLYLFRRDGCLWYRLLSGVHGW